MTFIVPEHRRKVHVGDRFGHQVVIGVPFYAEGSPGQQCVVTECDCGKVTITRAYSLNRPRRTSCGCQCGAKPKGKYPVSSGSDSPLYYRWSSMLYRCNNPKAKSYRNYGGRGIRVCVEWHDYQAFRTWAIESGFFDGAYIDRKDPNGGYCPDNCRWVSAAGSARNRRNTLYVTAFGETKTIGEWSEDIRCVAPNVRALLARIRNGWNPEDAITTVRVCRDSLVPAGSRKHEHSQ